MKPVFELIGHRTGMLLVVLALSLLNGCDVRTYLGKDNFVYREYSFFEGGTLIIPLFPAPTTQTGGIAVKAPSVSEFSSYVPSVPLRGNQSVIVGGAFGTAANQNGAILVRETNCSLTQYVVGTSNGSASTITSTLRNAQSFLHTLSGLAGTAGTFPRGCTDRLLGTSAQEAAYLGRAGNGDLLSAVVDDKLSRLTVLRFNTIGVAVGSTELIAANGARAMAVADFNGDGIADIVVPFMVSGGASGIGVFLSRADGTFGAATIYGGYTSFATRFNTTVAIEDLNGDGRLDIVAMGPADRNNSSANVYSLLGAGAGVFAAGPSSGSLSSSSDFVLADFNGDRRVDLLSGNGELMSGTGTGAFLAPTSVGARGNNFALGDLDDDGKLDVVARTTGNSITVYKGNGDGTFAIGASYAGIRGAKHLHLVDLNGDGMLDVVVGLVGPGVYGPNPLSETMMQFLFGRGDGTLTGARVLPDVGSTAFGVARYALADVTGDGFPDLVAAGPGSAARLDLYPGAASGNFGAATTLANLGSAPIAVASADFNGDGLPDIVAAGGNVALLRGLGGGLFAATQTYALPNVTAAVVNLAVGDINGDGRADLVLLLGGATASSGGAFVYIANTDGTLKSPVQIHAATNLLAIAMGDVNGDRRADIVIGGQFGSFVSAPNPSADVRLYLGNADGSVTAGTSIASGDDYTALAIADMNRDGKADVVFSNAGAKVSILPGLGNGSFGAVSTFTIANGGPGIRSLTIADFSGDGNPDVMIAGGEYSALLLGKGDGTLVGPAALVLANEANHMTTADLNRDGAPDLVAALTQGGGIVSLPRVASVRATTSSAPVASEFTIALGSASGSVPSGQSVQTTVSLSFGAGFTSPVTFTCSGLPANADCGFNPATVTPNAGSVNTTVTIRTGATVAARPAPRLAGESRQPASAGLPLAFGFALAGLGVLRARRPVHSAGLALAVSIVVLLTSCGGGGGGGGATSGGAAATPAGTYAVTITGTGGGVSKSVNYSLNVQ